MNIRLDSVFEELASEGKDQNDYCQAWRIDIVEGIKRAKVNGMVQLGCIRSKGDFATLARQPCFSFNHLKTWYGNKLDRSILLHYEIELNVTVQL